MKGRQIVYSPAELAWLEANHALPIGDYHFGFSVTFGRDVSAENLHAFRVRKGWKTGRTGRFEKGQVPPNKGKKMPFHPNSAATQFKPGHRGGAALEKYKPIGSERLSKEGYLERKIHDGRPFQSRWRAVHLLNWEAVNGPIPEGTVLKCLDSNKANLEPGNWEAVPRAILPRLNGGPRNRTLAYDGASPELKPTILAAARLQHRARAARKAKAP